MDEKIPQLTLTPDLNETAPAVQPETAADSQPVQNSVTKPATLPQTGQNWWPVWILSILGLVSLTAGITLRRR